MKTAKRIAAFIIASLLLVSLLPSSVFASGEEAVPPVTLSGDRFPSKFDLRDMGVVTPVKQQNPWGSCWAFAATAAVESSILTKMGSTYAATGFDLSERHLSWYVARPVTENISQSQAGEGLNIYNVEAGPNHIYNFGGREECAATLFAQGIGPVSEAEYPYRGVDGRLAYEDLLADKEGYIAVDMAALREFDHYASDETLRRYAESDYEYDLERYKVNDVYSPLDDWSVTDADEPGSGKLRGSSYTLTDNNVITYWVRKGTGDMDGNERYEAEGNMPLVTWDTSNLYQDSIDQIKAELYAGRGVAVDFSIADNVLNGETWAVYNDHSLQTSRHAVCIVGWDDDYPASNFTHTRTPSGQVMKDSSGREITDERAREITTPPGNGAWICKNSWGSETDAIPCGLIASDGTTKDANANNWGIVDENGRHTGYFYLSYYDYTIGVPESFDFDLRENHDQENALQLDYLPASSAEWRNTGTSPMWEANVFTLDKDMRIEAVATRIRMSDTAPLSGFKVTFDLYKLRDGATRPDDGELLTSFTRIFENEGYHRAALDAPVYLKAGDRLGVVVQQSHTFGDGVTKYCVSAQETISYRARPEWRRDPLWGNPVVNEGESFWKAEGITDREEGAVDGWLDITQPLTSSLNLYLNPETWFLWENGYLGEPLWDFFSMDNFCIKAFGEPCTPDAPEPGESVETEEENDDAPVQPDDGKDDWIKKSLLTGAVLFNPPQTENGPAVPAAADEEKEQTDAAPVVPEEPEIPFLDVTASDPFYTAVRYVYKSGLMNGMSATEFGPSTPLTRAMFVTVLGRMAQVDPEQYAEVPFTDVEPLGDWDYVPYVAWASETGIVLGYGDGTFGPTDLVTNEQVMLMMQRFVKYLGYTVTPAESAADGASPWTADAVAWALENGICPTDTNADFTDAAQRGWLAQAIYNLVGFMVG